MEQEHRIDRHGGLEVGDDLVAERLVDLLHRLAGGHGEGAQALDHLPALGLAALAPDRERRAEHRQVLAVAALAKEAGLLEELMAGGDGREGVGLGAEARGEDLFHGRDLDRGGVGRQGVAGGALSVLAWRLPPRRPNRAAGAAALFLISGRERAVRQLGLDGGTEIGRRTGRGACRKAGCRRSARRRAILPRPGPPRRRSSPGLRRRSGRGARPRRSAAAFRASAPGGRH